jgi:antitoxin Phd
MATWQLQEAKDKFSEVLEQALREGPQMIAARGESVAVLISNAEYARLTQAKPRFVEFMRSSPLFGVELDTARQTSEALHSVGANRHY